LRILGGVSSFPSRCGTQLKHCSRGCTRWTGDLHLGLHPDFVRPFHIPTDPTWPHTMRARSPWQKTDLRKKILYGKTAKAAHLHQKKVPKRTFLANLAVRVSKNHTKPDRPTRHPSPSTLLSPPLHLVGAAPRCRPPPSHHYGLPPQRLAQHTRPLYFRPIVDHSAQDARLRLSDLAPAPPYKFYFLAPQACCKGATTCIR